MTSPAPVIARAPAPPDEIVVFRARHILTMNPAQPEATHVAVQGGRILAVGDASILDEPAWQAARLDERFAGQVLLPGFVEGHSHLMEGGVWEFVYCGYHDRRDPDGRLWPGLKSFDEVVGRLRQAEAQLADPTAPLLGWGFDPIHFGTARMTVAELDRVSRERPVAVMHANFHLLNANGAMLRRAGIGRHSEAEGVARDEAGEPTGELQETAMFPVFRAIDNAFYEAGQTVRGAWNFARAALQGGVTTATDLVSDLAPDTLAQLHDVTADPAYPVRLVPAFLPLRAPGVDGVARVLEARRRNTDKLIAGPVKFVLDGSIQGFTGRLKWPGYHNGRPNGLWLVPPPQVREQLEPYHRAGLTLHLHVNGDEASELAIEALEELLADHPRADHRHTLQHCQLADAAQFRRMKALGLCANLFANHLYYWGDAHAEQTLGPARAARLDACGTALREGVPFSIHSDAPITPLAPLFSAWCAVNRISHGGRLLGPGERIPVADALRAITLGAAYTLKLDHVAGSIETGKWADFAVLDDDPLAVPPEALKDVPVWGTVLGGRPFAAPRPA